MSHALGIDVGSTNAKVVLVAADGRTIATAARPIATRRDGEVAEQDPEALWRAVASAIREVVAADRPAAGDIAAIGVCSQYSSIVPVDARGRAVAPLKMYMDRRGGDRTWSILERHADAFPLWIERHGIPPLGSGVSLAHLLHFQHERPDVHARTAAYLEPMDFVNLRLTGRAVANQCTMMMAGVCDNRTVGVTRYDDDLVRVTGLDPTRLPPLGAIDGVVGPIASDVAAELGLPKRAVVHAAMNDSQAAAFATGAFGSGRAGVVIGTTSVLLDDIAEKALDLDHLLMSMPSPLPGRYLVWAENGIAGKAVEHILQRVLQADDALGGPSRGDAFEALDAALAAAPPASGGVLFLPWLGGSLAPCLADTMRGGFLNVSLDTSRLDLVRATIEGIAHNLRWLLGHVEAFTGRRIEEVAFAGGAARSRGWAQILADVLDRPVHVVADSSTAVARAAGLVALFRNEERPAEDASALARESAVCEPAAAHRARYDAMHAQFVAAFEAVRPICEALNG
ncbi:MAG TPA: FGGY family carbohydrate kinase [Candidatus Binatia bacterium]|nr:FGGY family carbohydrate kinase [Candidatus Binatia bacterium]